MWKLLQDILTILGDGNQKTQLTGRKAKLVVGSYGKTLALISNGAEDIIVTPTAGELWRLISLGVSVAAPAGAGSGLTAISFRVLDGTTDNYAQIALSAPYNQTLSYNLGAGGASTTLYPALPANFLANLKNVIATNDKPIRVNVYNATNVPTDKALTLIMGFEVEAVTW